MSWLPKATFNPKYPQFCGVKVCANACTFEQKEKEKEQQYNKNKSRIKLRYKLDKDLLDEQLKWQLFEHEQRHEMEKIELQKKKDEYVREEQHKRLLGKQSFKTY